MKYTKKHWQNYYVGIDGGNDGIKYSSSIGYTDDGGVALAYRISTIKYEKCHGYKNKRTPQFCFGV